VERASRHVARRASSVAVVAAARRVARKRRVGDCVCNCEDNSSLSDDSVWR
jgi:hypothetical protein